MLIKPKLPSHALLGCRDLPAESPPHIAGIGGPSYWGESRRLPRSAISFGASPSANPVSDRKSRCTKALPRRRAETEYRRRSQRPSGRRASDRPLRRPDRIALLGGRDGRDRDGRRRHQRPRRLRRHRVRGGTGGSGRCPDVRFGARALQPGRLRRRRQDAPLAPQGELLRRPAGQGLRQPDDRARCGASSAATASTPTAWSASGPARRIVRTMPKSVATWYGPGFTATAPPAA